MRIAESQQNILAYSYRRLWTHDKQPYISTRIPWQNSDEKENLHRSYLDSEGIRRFGSPLMRDALFSKPLDGYAGTIDLGEWLFPTNFFREMDILPLMTEEEYLKGEDDLILWKIIDKRLKIAPTRQFTLNYRLGGKTNNR